MSLKYFTLSHICCEAKRVTLDKPSTRRLRFHNVRSFRQARNDGSVGVQIPDLHGEANEFQSTVNFRYRKVYFSSWL